MLLDGDFPSFLSAPHTWAVTHRDRPGLVRRRVVGQEWGRDRWLPEDCLALSKAAGAVSSQPVREQPPSLVLPQQALGREHGRCCDPGRLCPHGLAWILPQQGTEGTQGMLRRQVTLEDCRLQGDRLHKGPTLLTA